MAVLVDVVGRVVKLLSGTATPMAVLGHGVVLVDGGVNKVRAELLDTLIVKAERVGIVHGVGRAGALRTLLHQLAVVASFVQVQTKVWLHPRP